MEAEMIYGLAQAYHALPEAGAVMDQPVWVVRMHGILDHGGHFARPAGSVPAADDPLAGIPMVTL